MLYNINQKMLIQSTDELPSSYHGKTCHIKREKLTAEGTFYKVLCYDGEDYWFHETQLQPVSAS